LRSNSISTRNRSFGLGIRLIPSLMGRRFYALAYLHRSFTVGLSVFITTQRCLINFTLLNKHFFVQYKRMMHFRVVKPLTWATHNPPGYNTTNRSISRSLNNINCTHDNPITV
jgi:hypothetical protein